MFITKVRGGQGWDLRGGNKAAVSCRGQGFLGELCIGGYWKS